MLQLTAICFTPVTQELARSHKVPRPGLVFLHTLQTIPGCRNRNLQLRSNAFVRYVYLPTLHPTSCRKRLAALVLADHLDSVHILQCLPRQHAHSFAQHMQTRSRVGQKMATTVRCGQRFRTCLPLPTALLQCANTSEPRHKQTKGCTREGLTRGALQRRPPTGASRST